MECQEDSGSSLLSRELLSLRVGQEGLNGWQKSGGGEMDDDDWYAESEMIRGREIKNDVVLGLRDGRQFWGEAEKWVEVQVHKWLGSWRRLQSSRAPPHYTRRRPFKRQRRGAQSPLYPFQSHFSYSKGIIYHLFIIISFFMIMISNPIWA